MKAHLLHRDRDLDLGTALPPHHEALIQDLGVTTLLEAMAGDDTVLRDVSRSVILRSLDDPEAIVYRQQILADCIAEPEIIREMYAIALAASEDRRGIWGYLSPSPSSILSGAVARLEGLVVQLERMRRIADEHAHRFRSNGLTALFATLRHELDDEYLATVRHHLRVLRFRGGTMLSAELDRDNSGIGYVLRSPGGARQRWRERLGIAPRTSYSFTVPPRDDGGFRALSELTNRGLNLVANAAAQSADHILGYFTMLRGELGFYVGCLNLRDTLVARGAPIAFPEPMPSTSLALSSVDLRDASLTLRTEEGVVGNDVDADGRTLMIITGANSGGKSTFLRSVGLAQLMMQCGMFVAAAAYRASVCRGIFTHFVREEDASMRSGRLDEELSRMSAIADHLTLHSLVLFNEPFATTNEREGSEIARQVVRALLEAQIRVLCVTHQFDFAESCRIHHRGSTLFLRAERGPGGERSYRLAVAEPLATSFGQDIFHRLGGWPGDECPT